MDTKYKEWKERQRHLKREVELLTQEADQAHNQLVARWCAEDPAFELNNYNIELRDKLNQARSALALNSKTKPKEATCSDHT